MKMIKILVATLVMAAMVTPVIAEDRLTLSGSLQVRHNLVDYDLESIGTTSVDTDGYYQEESSTDSWFDMRMRIAGKIAVAEGVSAHFRFDTNESMENSSDPLAWGHTNRYSARRADIQFDYAYMQLVKNGFTLKAGEMYFGGFGHNKVVDFTAPGFSLGYGDFTIVYAVTNEENQGNETLLKDTTDGEASLVAAKYDFKTDGFSATPFIGFQMDDSNVDYNLTGVGVYGAADLGPVALKYELDYFDGEQGSVDMYGLQGMLDGSIAATDTVRVGLQGLYAQGDDDDRQVTDLNVGGFWAFADFNPQNLGSGDFAYSDNFDIYNPGKYFWSGASTGVIAGGIYADVKASDDLALKFGGMMFEGEEDDDVDCSGYFLNAKASYKLMANTTLSAHLNYMSIEEDYSDTSDEALGLLTTLAVSF